MYTYVCSKCNSTDIEFSSVSKYNVRSQQWRHAGLLDDGYCQECDSAAKIYKKAIIHKAYLAFSDDILYELLQSLDLHKLTEKTINKTREGFESLLDAVIAEIPDLLEKNKYRVFISGSDTFYQRLFHSPSNGTEEMRNRIEPILKAIRFDQAISGTVP